MFIDTILPLAIPKLLTYQVPSALAKLIKPGSSVLVPLGKKKILTGIVNNIHQNTPSYPTKLVIDILGTTPIINSIQLQFFQWIAEYYMCYLGEVIKMALPSGLRLSSQSKIQLNPAWNPAYTSLSADEICLITEIKNKKVIGYDRLNKKVPNSKLVKGLIQKNVILIFESLQEKYQPKKEKYIRLHEEYIQNTNALKNLFDHLEKKTKQLDILLQYLAKSPIDLTKNLEQYFLPKKYLLNQALSTTALQHLIKQKIFIEKSLIVSRLSSIDHIQKAHNVLSSSQQKAFEAIKKQFEYKNTVLLHGITGSGKTAIYIHLIQESLRHEGQILYLLPEIGLATQIVKRLQAIFGNQLIVYHSKYASNERVEIWNSVLQKRVRLIIGVRSALFLPFSKLDLIIIDEEHEVSYKQLDTLPRYHARDAAAMLAKFHQAKILLGSATPAIETYYQAKIGKYGLVKLTERFNQTPLPNIILANVRAAKQKKMLQEEFTPTLLQEIKQALALKEQVIIFKNRRGYAPYIRCQECAWVPTCTKCSVSLTYHQLNNALVCHYCGYHTRIFATCQICTAPQLHNIGSGTEKLAESLQRFFPDQYIQRMDLDTTRKKFSYEKIIEHVEQGKTDILVGTQMITKGLDFGQVSLVGVIDVDRHLYFPDFRAHERCFQLITQVSGRAGRRSKQGKVIIQTANPAHPVLKYITTHDYEQMYQQELVERNFFLYPPYVRLIKLTLQYTEFQLLGTAAKELTTQLRILLGTEWILGPQTPLVAKVKQQYRMDLWIKLRTTIQGDLRQIKHKIQTTAKQVLSKQAFKPIKLIFDVDPM